MKFYFGPARTYGDGLGWMEWEDNVEIPWKNLQFPVVYLRYYLKK